ncbi:MAG: ATP-binding protein [Burkholderiaceae bacterium]
MPVSLSDAKAQPAGGEGSQAAGRLVVWVGNNAHAAALVRYAARLAAATGASWTAIRVDSRASLRMAPSERIHALQALEIAERLGASTATVTADNAISGVVERVRNERASMVLLGAHAAEGWLGGLRGRWLGGLADALGRRLPHVTINVVNFPEDPAVAAPPAAPAVRRGWPWQEWLVAVAIVASCTIVSDMLLSSLQIAGATTVYLAGVVYVALRSGQSAALLTVVLSILAFDLVFVMPRWSLKPTDPEHYLVFLVMLVVGVLISRLVAQARVQALVADGRARRALALNELAHHLVSASSEQAVEIGLGAAVQSTFGARSVLLLPDKGGTLRDRAVFAPGDPREPAAPMRDDELACAGRAFGQGCGTETAVDPATGLVTLCVALRGTSGALGVLLVRTAPGRFASIEDRQLLDAFASQAALALERSLFERRSAAAVVDAETERLRNTLLSGISHDFRSPMTTIVGSATSLLEQDDELGAEQRVGLLRSIVTEARRLHASMSDLLDLARMEEGAVKANCEWCPADELIVAAREALGARLLQRSVRVFVQPDAVVWCDPRLLEQLLVNLLDNALRHTPPDSSIEIRAEASSDHWSLEVADDGPGLQPGQRNELFKKFCQGRSKGAGAGTGLGLAICAAVARMHGGTIVERGESGACFRVVLPQPAAVVPAIEEAT